MKKFYSVKLFLVSSSVLLPLTLFAAVPQTPDVEGYLNYKGYSFDAYWSPIEGAESYLLNVYSNKGEQLRKTVDFTSATAPEHWTYTTSGMHKADDGNEYILLKNDGDGVVFFNPDGVVENFIISGLSIGYNDDAVTNDNSAVLKFDLIDNSGHAWYHVAVQGYAFSQLPTIDLKQAFGDWPDNVVGVKVSIGRTDAQPYGEIALKAATYLTHEREYFLRDYETEECLLTVDDLDSSLDYAYFVAAKNSEGQSPYSDIIRVDGFLGPAATYHADVTDDSYTAEWAPSAKADVYYINHYKLIESGEDTTIDLVADSFNKSTQGSIENPVEVENPDDFTDTPGWAGSTMIAAPGMFGAGAGYYGSAYVDTPRADASANDGKFQIYVKAKGTPGDRLNIIRQNYYIFVDGKPQGVMYQRNFGEDGWFEETIDCEDGRSVTYFTFEAVASDGKSQNPFLIDEFKLMQSNMTDSYSRVFLGRKYTEGRYNTTYTFTGLEPGGLYGYEVEAARINAAGEEVFAAVTDLHVVQLSGQASIELPESHIVISVENGVIKAEVQAETALAVYDLQGRELFSTLLPAGVSNTGFAPGSGVYIFKIGSEVKKVMVK